MRRYKGIAEGVNFKGNIVFQDIIELQEKMVAAMKTEDVSVTIQKGINAVLTDSGFAISEGILLWGGFPATFEGATGMSLDKAKYFAITVTSEDTRTITGVEYFAYEYYRAIITEYPPQIGGILEGSKVVDVVPFILRVDDCDTELIPNVGNGSDGDVFVHRGMSGIVRTCNGKYFLLLRGCAFYQERYKSIGEVAGGIVIIGNRVNVENEVVTIYNATERASVPLEGKLKDLLAQLAKNYNDMKEIGFSASYYDLEVFLKDANDLAVTCKSWKGVVAPKGSVYVPEALSLLGGAVTALEELSSYGLYNNLTDKPTSLSDLFNDIDSTVDREVKAIPVGITPLVVPRGWFVANGDNGTDNLNGTVLVAGLGTPALMSAFVSSDSTLETKKVIYIQRIKIMRQITIVAPVGGAIGVTRFHSTQPSVGGNVVFSVETGSRTFYAVPNKHYKFVSMQFGTSDIRTTNPSTVNVDADLSIRVIFRKENPVTAFAYSKTRSLRLVDVNGITGTNVSLEASSVLVKTPVIVSTLEYFAGFEVNGVAASYYNEAGFHQLRIDNIEAPTLIRALFRDFYKVNIKKIGEGTVTGDIEKLVLGAVASITATPSNGWKLKYITWEDSEGTHNVTTAIASIVVEDDNPDVTVTFEKTSKLTVRTEDNSTTKGSISILSATPSASQTDYVNSTAKTLIQAIPAYGYQLNRWESSLGDYRFEERAEVRLDQDSTYIAIFTPIKYRITVDATPNSYGTVDGDGTYLVGTVATLTANTLVGKKFKHWLKIPASQVVTIVSTSAMYLPVITESCTYRAVFEVSQELLILSVRTQATGTVSGGGSYPYGAVATANAQPAPYYEFEGWYENNVRISSQAIAAIVLRTPRTLVANFVRMTAEVVLTVYPESFGTVTGSGTKNLGSSVLITAVGNVGHDFTGWYNGDALESPLANYEFFITDDIILTARFS